MDVAACETMQEEEMTENDLGSEMFLEQAYHGRVPRYGQQNEAGRSSKFL